MADIVGIDTGGIIGLFRIQTDDISICESIEFDSIKKCAEYLENSPPDIAIFEKIVSYGLGMDAAVIRAIADIGYLTRCLELLNTETYFHTKAEWRYALFNSRKKHTDAQVKKKIVEYFCLGKKIPKGKHWFDAAGLVYCFMKKNPKIVERVNATK